MTQIMSYHCLEGCKTIRKYINIIVFQAHSQFFGVANMFFSGSNWKKSLNWGANTNDNKLICRFLQDQMH